MAILEHHCNDGPNDTLRKILTGVNALSAGGGVGDSVGISSVGGTATSVNCGTANAGTLRVAVATDCVVAIDGPVTVDNAAGAASVNIQDGGNSITVDGTVAVSNFPASQPISGSVTVINAAGAAAVNIQDGGNSITVDGTVAIGSSVTPGTAATNLGKAEDSVAVSGDVGVFALGVANEAQTTLAADGDYIAHSTDTKGNHMVVGNIANDGVDAGNPVKIGAQARTTIPTAVADGDRVNLMAGKHGSLVTIHAIREALGQQVTTITASVAETTIATAVATVFLDLYGIIVTNTSATAVNVAIKDATAGTTRMNIAVPANETRGFMLPACDGHKQAVVNNNWTATVSASVTSVIITTFTRQTT